MIILNLKPCLPTNFNLPFLIIIHTTCLYSAVGNVSGYRCESDCRSSGDKFDPCRSNTFLEIDHEIVSSDILLRLAESFKKGCCQLQAKVYA